MSICRLKKSDFERRCHAGEVLSRKEAKLQAQATAAEEAQIKTFKQYCKAVYMPDLTVRCSENTRSNYQNYLNNWIYPAFGECKLPSITAEQIEALFLQMQKAGKSNSTVVKVYTILKGVFKKAYKGKNAAANPMLIVDRPKPIKGEVKKKQPEAYTAPELLYIRQCLDQEPLKWKALVYFLSDTGVRRGECCALQWKNLDFKNCTVSICDSLGYTPHAGVFKDTPKNDRNWDIDVDPFVMDLLLQLRREQLRTGKVSQYVFTQNNSTEPMHPQSPTRYLRRLQE